MNVHLFGKNDSPCIANFSLKQSVKDQKNKFKKQIDKMGFRLTKWVSNNQEILEQLPKNELKFKEKLEQLSDESKFQKVLGLLWNLTSDTLKIPSTIKINNVKFTKRSLLSIIC